MYDLLLQLPIFQGLTYAQLTEILEKVPFHFKKFRTNEFLVQSGEVCNEVMFVLSGRVRMVTPIFKETMMIAQDFEAPHTIPFYNLFGKDIYSRNSIFAQSSVGVMTLDKENFLKILETNRLMLINVLNILSSHAQKQHWAMDSVGAALPPLRVAMWLLSFTYHSAKNIVVDADENDWCSLFNLNKSELSEAMSVLQKTDTIEYSEGKLRLSDRYGLRAYVNRSFEENK